MGQYVPEPEIWGLILFCFVLGKGASRIFPRHWTCVPWGVFYSSSLDILLILLTDQTWEILTSLCLFLDLCVEIILCSCGG